MELVVALIENLTPATLQIMLVTLKRIYDTYIGKRFTLNAQI